MSERPKERASKARVGETQPWVQIPPPPPVAFFHNNSDIYYFDGRALSIFQEETVYRFLNLASTQKIIERNQVADYLDISKNIVINSIHFMNRIEGSGVNLKNISLGVAHVR